MTTPTPTPETPTPRRAYADRVRGASVDAAELLDEAARLITAALRVDDATAHELRVWESDGARWLRRFERDIAR